MIEPVKLQAYLLSATHPVERFKAAFFAAVAYSADGWQRLEDDRRSQHLTQDATPVAANAYGQKCEIRAALVGPTGRAAAVVSVWVVLTGEDFPRFVTAYPRGSE